MTGQQFLAPFELPRDDDPMSVIEKKLKDGRTVKLVHRSRMRRKTPMRRATLPASVPSTLLPVDSFGPTPPVFNMDDNDTEGICGPAMCDHVDVVYRWRLGKGTQLQTSVSALSAQYLKISGGDNGTDEDMLVGPQGIWTPAGGGLAGDSTQVVDDKLDVDITNIPLTQYLIDQFFTVQMAWSVPDDFLQNFTPGSVWLDADTPNPANGHYTPLANVDETGVYTLITWGATCQTGPNFIASVQPQTFAVFSRQQFDPKTGLDAKNRHVSTQGAAWVGVGGNAAAVAAVVAMFPPVVGPTPAPAPSPPPPPTPVPDPPPAPIPFPPAPTPVGVLISQVQATTALTLLTDYNQGKVRHWPHDLAAFSQAWTPASHPATASATGGWLSILLQLFALYGPKLVLVVGVVQADVAAGKTFFQILQDVAAVLGPPPTT